jgi:hypothetical protein
MCFILPIRKRCLLVMQDELDEWTLKSDSSIETGALPYSVNDKLQKSVMYKLYAMSIIYQLSGLLLGS